MPSMVVRHSPDEYLRLFDEIFLNDALKTWRDDFFAGNAARFLGLRAYARRMANVLSAQAVAYLESLDGKEGSAESTI
jgi:hypothetical protein